MKPVRGALGSSTETTAAACESLNLERAYTSLDELAADATVDVVHLCTPNYLHFDQASRLLRAGKHVLCEKPLTMDSAESELLVALVRETGKVGGVAYNLRYYPLCQEARALVEKGAIGQPKLVHGSFLQDWLLYPGDWNWRLDPKLGGQLRAVSDIGTHWLDLVTWITGRKVTELCADGECGSCAHRDRRLRLRFIPSGRRLKRRNDRVPGQRRPPSPLVV